MSKYSETSVQINIYEGDFSEEITLNLSSKELIFVPEINNRYLCVLYLQNNKLRALPDDFFPSLPNLKWLDLRNNELLDIPQTIKNHKSLTHFLLQNNKITSLPNELGTVTTLKVLQLSGNPIMYPPRDIINMGTSKILCFLHNKLVEEIFEESQSIASDKASESGHSLEKFIHEGRSYNSVIDGAKIQRKALSVQFNEKDISEYDDEQEEYYTKIKGKCPKLPKSRTKILKPYNQSAKYLKPLMVCSKKVQEDKMKQSYFRDLALKKQKDLIAKRDKILQGRRNIELLRDWQKDYKYRQMTLLCNNDTYKLIPKVYPYDTNPEYMTLLSREDIEKDLPDKYKRKLFRKSKPTVPRKNNNDVHLAMKIKQLFENLEAIDLNRDTMSPRTEQKILLGEIQKISEIKQKLLELSTTNTRSVTIE